MPTASSTFTINGDVPGEGDGSGDQVDGVVTAHPEDTRAEVVIVR